jgi:hypothetical protein
MADQTGSSESFSGVGVEVSTLAAARSSSSSDEFDALIFGAGQTDKVETSTPTPEKDSELPV